MKILTIDKYYFVKGGAERYFFELANILASHGHEVIPFSMQHPNNYSTPYSDYFVSEINYQVNGSLNKVSLAAKSLSRMIYSLEAKKKVTQLIEKIRPDIAHIHMIDHQISPSILHAFHNYGIPVLQTVHQYKLVCPNYRFYNPRKESVCEKCLDGRFYHPIFERCHKDSYLAGAMLALESGLHRWARIYEKHVDLFHVPSHFMGAKLVKGGIDPEKIFHLFYTIDLKDFQYSVNFENYIVYFGRLSEEKGILTLLQAMKSVHKTELLLVGSGPQEPLLRDFVAANDLKNVRFLGYKEKDEILKIISNAMFIVVPSEWYDNSPLVIYEAMAMGKPVVGSNLGGIPELVDDNENGLIFSAGNSEELSAKMNALLENKSRLRSFSRAARQKAEKEFEPEVHYEKIVAKYKQLIELGSKKIPKIKSQITNKIQLPNIQTEKP